MESRKLAAIIGPVLIAIAVTEWRNLDLGVFSQQTAPVVYFNGTILLVAGLSIVRAHNRWNPDWSILISLVGWALLLGGLYRMWAPGAPQMQPGYLADAMFVAIGAIGLVLAYQGFRRVKEGPESAWPIKIDRNLVIAAATIVLMAVVLLLLHQPGTCLLWEGCGAH